MRINNTQAEADKAEIEKAWPEVVSVHEGKLRLGNSIARPQVAGNIASAFRDIAKNPQEALYAVFFNDKGRIQSIHIHSKGLISNSLSDQKLIAGKAFR